jgi:Gamma-glutamyl cyclotransferase, AIG2-like
MWYFAYGTDLNWHSLLDWARSAGCPIPQRGAPQRAVLTNHRLCFPIYDEQWRGGVADVVPEPGKTVSGALFNIRPSLLATLDRLFGRTQDKWDRENGIRRRARASVMPYCGGRPISAVLYRLQNPDWRHVPPTALYLQRMIDAACGLGLSAMWVMQLGSFLTQAVKTPTQTAGSKISTDSVGPKDESHLAIARSVRECGISVHGDQRHPRRRSTMVISAA